MKRLVITARASRRVAALVACLLMAATTSAGAERSIAVSGLLQSDLRFRLAGIGEGGWYSRLEAPAGIARNDNFVRLRAVAKADRFSAVVELDLAYYGYALRLSGFEDIYRREIVDPFRVEARAAYIEARNLFLNGFDLRIGQQTVSWGAGDQFNPTNAVNPLDLEDPLAFGEQLANMMVRADYSHRSSFSLTAVMVPIFRPALLPRTAPIGVGMVERMPFADRATRWRSATEAWMIEKLGYPTVVSGAEVALPKPSFNNIQWAGRIAATLFEQDLSLIVYHGRADIPLPFANVASISRAKRCNPTDAAACISGLLDTRVALMYPRYSMVGFNATGELPNPLALFSKKALPLGYRFELAVFFPQRVDMVVVNRDLDLGGGLAFPSGQYPAAGVTHEVLPDTPFAKWVLGIDYTISPKLYFNAMWIHGFPDEFGAGDFFSGGDNARYSSFDRASNAASACASAVITQNLRGGSVDFSPCVREVLKPRLSDYLALGFDYKFLADKGLFRLFGIIDLTGVYEEYFSAEAKGRVRDHHGPFSAEGFSAVLAPELQYDFGQGLELAMGAFISFGKGYSKFGEAAAGGQVVWTRARLSY